MFAESFRVSVYLWNLGSRASYLITYRWRKIRRLHQAIANYDASVLALFYLIYREIDRILCQLSIESLQTFRTSQFDIELYVSKVELDSSKRRILWLLTLKSLFRRGGKRTCTGCFGRIKAQLSLH